MTKETREIAKRLVDIERATGIDVRKMPTSEFKKWIEVVKIKEI